MTTGLSVTVANGLVDAICSAVDFTAPVEFWVKLHTGDPGDDGTANAAGETTRQQAAFNAADAGAADTSADLAWISVSDTEIYSYLSFWDDSAAGNFLGSNRLVSARSVTAGDDFTISAGDLTFAAVPVAA